MRLKNEANIELKNVESEVKLIALAEHKVLKLVSNWFSAGSCVTLLLYSVD